MTVNEILNEFGRKIVKELSANLNTYGYKGGKIDASGKLRSSIKFTTRILGDDYSFQLSMADYYQWVDEGRKAGTYPNISEIQNWLMQPVVRTKLNKSGFFNKGSISKGKKALGINIEEKTLRQLVGGIAGNIKKRGIKPTYFFTDVYNDEALLDLKKKLSTQLSKNIKIELTEI